MGNNANEAYKIFTEKLLNIINQCIPHNHVTIRPNDKTWYDTYIRNIYRKRDRQHNIARLEKIQVPEK